MSAPTVRGVRAATALDVTVRACLTVRTGDPRRRYGITMLTQRASRSPLVCQGRADVAAHLRWFELARSRLIGTMPRCSMPTRTQAQTV